MKDLLIAEKAKSFQLQTNVNQLNSTITQLNSRLNSLNNELTAEREKSSQLQTIINQLNSTISLNYLKTTDIIKQSEKDWPNLTELDLCNLFINNSATNNIGVDGMKHLAETAKYWPNLTNLNLCN